MKLFLVAGSTLLTACAALGFARAVDQMTGQPPVAVLSPAGFQTERVVPDAPAPRAASQPPLRQIGSTAPREKSAMPPATPRLAAISQPVTEDFQQNTMYFLPPDVESGLAVAEPTRRYDFINLPIIGAYR